jgi:hypothetical protein
VHDHKGMDIGHRIPLTRRQRAISLFWNVVALLFGWSLFGYWWYVVSLDDQPRDLVLLALMIVLASLLLLMAVLGWVAHNRRLARAGTRGNVSRFQQLQYDFDALGRRVDAPPTEVIYNASLIIVDATEDTKTFSAPDPDHEVEWT